MSASDVMRAVLALCLALALPALAQPSREQEQIRRLRLQVQELQQEQAAALQRAASEKAALLTRLEAAQADLDQQRGSAAERRRAHAELQAEIAQLRGEAAQRQDELAALKGELERSTRAIDQARAEGAQRRTLLATREATFADLWARHQSQAEGLRTCILRNDGLVALGSELLQRYRDKGLGEVFSQNEPFLQSGRVKLENLVQGYRDRLDQGALKPVAGTSP